MQLDHHQPDTAGSDLIDQLRVSSMRACRTCWIQSWLLWFCRRNSWSRPAEQS